MEQVQVKITGMVMTHRYGTLSTGDILRTDAAYAKHLVEDCSAAEYITAPAVTVNTEKAPKTRAKKAPAEPVAAAPAVEATEESPAEITQPDTPQE
jgi:hypothetical protein